MFLRRKKRTRCNNKSEPPSKRFANFLKDLDNNGSDSDYSDDDDFDYGDSYGEVYSKGNKIYYKGDVDKENIEELIRIIEKKNDILQRKIERKEFDRNLMDLVDDKRVIKPFYLYITSYGGDLFECLAAIDAIKGSNNPIHSIIEGYSASAGTLMSVVASKRYMKPNSLMLIHQLSGGHSGTYENLIDDFKNSTEFMEKIKRIYKEHCKFEENELEELLKRDIWLNSEKCLNYGLVDEILTSAVRA
jgi:ATP-dependent Clp protease protease subunit